MKTLLGELSGAQDLPLTLQQQLPRLSWGLDMCTPIPFTDWKLWQHTLATLCDSSSEEVVLRNRHEKSSDSKIGGVL